MSDNKDKIDSAAAAAAAIIGNKVINNELPPNDNKIPTSNNGNNKPSSTPPVPNKQILPNASSIDGKYQEIIQGIRHDIVAKATQFLIDDQIRTTPLDRKVNFLRARGLSDREIQVSFKAAAICNDNAQNSDVLLPNPPDYSFKNISCVPDDESQSWLRQLAGPVTYGVTAVYIGYQLYKKYIEHWLFGMQMSPVEKRLEVVEVMVQKCINLVEEKNKNECISEQSNRQKDLDQIRAELKSIKSLLLNKFQFPPAPAYSSLPQWQLAKNAKSHTETQIKINDTETINLQLPTISILKVQNSIAGRDPRTVNGLASDTVKDTNCTLIKSKPKEINISSTSDQPTINNNAVATNIDDKVNVDNGDGK